MFVLALSVVFIGCNKEEEKVTITFTSDDITLDLGSTNADLLPFAKASDGSAVAVSGVNFDLAGEQTAIFTTGSTSESKSVKIKADKLAGTYVITVYMPDTSAIMIAGDGCILHAVKGANYNQINLATLMNSDDPKQFLPDLATLVFTFVAEKASIPTYTGGVLGISAPATATYNFSDIVYGKDENGRYAIKSFIMNGTAQPYTPFSIKAELKKTKD